MPTISMFYGIIVYMYAYDNNKHHLPHFHAQYAEHQVVLAIADGEILEGSLPSGKMKLIHAWLEIHRDELMADWRLAISGEQPYKIKPLD